MAGKKYEEKKPISGKFSPEKMKSA